MARLSDIIEEFIKSMLNESETRELEIGRNDLANQFKCAPSQISYVLTTRFSTDNGYYVESRRGGGGYIRIKRMEYKKNEALRKLFEEKIGNSITYEIAYKIIEGLQERNIITERESNIMKVAINDRNLIIPVEQRNIVRAEILKSMIKIILL
ncbi:CtsR family transcriptional regulator [Clostridium novyi B str. ATCC 27606]|uniref:Transcriptional regulator CtsR n=1 Tax=Clostridium novyi B str. ATCC 27606 TaxID=1443123 RepID=A0AA40IWT2_CLONO|nr:MULTISPECIES: CtsR family transcriptional regulator [Clostridium]KEI12311.1 CtsR family transcriptional regulator [Clostridium novyi B str. NCTC 9691]KEI18397.1 CtsR family transcriptional regulator [Clostridium novyi B str. ATCC 27606]OOB75954.1 CtsR family transcriptional regulator [Clostridium haemolyticum]CAG7838901.1 Transcriptional regulator CtsR [Clostridium haemolyticum]